MTPTASAAAAAAAPDRGADPTARELPLVCARARPLSERDRERWVAGVR